MTLLDKLLEIDPTIYANNFILLNAALEKLVADETAPLLARITDQTATIVELTEHIIEVEEERDTLARTIATTNSLTEMAEKADEIRKLKETNEEWRQHSIKITAERDALKAKVAKIEATAKDYLGFIGFGELVKSSDTDWCERLKELHDLFYPQPPAPEPALTWQEEKDASGNTWWNGVGDKWKYHVFQCLKDDAVAWRATDTGKYFDTADEAKAWCERDYRAKL